MPGISVPGKLLIAQISTGLGTPSVVFFSPGIRTRTVVFMGGIIGNAEPLFSCADWSTIKTEVDPVWFAMIFCLNVFSNQN
jgi:hypothetical protein